MGPKGDDGAARPRAGDSVYVGMIMKRLQAQFMNGVPLPGQEQPLSLTLLYKLYRYVQAEGYGEGGQDNA